MGLCGWTLSFAAVTADNRWNWKCNSCRPTSRCPYLTVGYNRLIAWGSGCFDSWFPCRVELKLQSGSVPYGTLLEPILTCAVCVIHPGGRGMLPTLLVSGFSESYTKPVRMQIDRVLRMLREAQNANNERHARVMAESHRFYRMYGCRRSSIN